MYNVLEPIYTPTGEKFTVGRGKSRKELEYYNVSFKVIGKAKNMGQAKRKYGGYPILKAI